VDLLVSGLWKAQDNGVESLGKTCGLPRSAQLFTQLESLQVGNSAVDNNWHGVSEKVTGSGVLYCQFVCEKLTKR
jgi:hypothetical protein